LPKIRHVIIYLLKDITMKKILFLVSILLTTTILPGCEVGDVPYDSSASLDGTTRANEKNTLIPMVTCSWGKDYNPTAFGTDVQGNVCQPTSCLITMADHEDSGLNALIRHAPGTICVRIVKDISNPSIRPKLKLFGFDLLPDRTTKINGVPFNAPSPTAIIYEDSTINQSVLNTPSDGFNYAEITPTFSTTFPYDDVRPLMWEFTQ